MSKWMVSAKKADFEAIASKFNIDKVLARIIRNRDIVSDEEIDYFLNGTLKDIHDPALMKDLSKASGLIKEAIGEGKYIRIIGDYDVDGITSTYILLKGLKTMGARVDTVIPHRIRDGYGLNDNLIEEANRDGVNLILTCDNGIAASAQVSLANSLGMEVIVTDHHEVPFDITPEGKKYIIPEALAVVDPKQDDCPYPFKSICGAVVAYKLIGYIFNGEHKEVYDELLPFAALGTICDVMDLKDENRIIVKEGLKAMAETKNFGLKALLMVNDLTDKPLTNYHMGFVVGPCLNATGRLDTASRALELFDAPDFKSAVTIATELKALNESRKKMTEDGVEEADELIVSTGLYNDKVLVIYLPSVHESLAGIIAGRIKEKYMRPTFVVTNAEEGLKGSGRSIEAYDMYEALTEVKDLFTKFGGHKMAAGISLRDEDSLKELRRRLNENANLTDDDFVKKIHIDVPMPLSYISENFIESLDILEPFGTGNPKPVFATKDISLLSYIKIGKNKNVGKFKVKDANGFMFDMISFGPLEDFDEFLVNNFGKEKFDDLLNERVSGSDIMISIVYYPEINEFRGRCSIQIIMNDYDVSKK